MPRFLCLIVILLSSAFVCLVSGSTAAVAESGPAASQPAEVPPGWGTVDAHGQFKMQLPPDLKKEDVKGIDSAVLQFRGAGLVLSSDYGWYSDPLQYREKPKIQRTETTVGGKKAVIVTFEEPDGARDMPLRAGIHFPDPTGDGRIRLTVFASCKDVAAQRLAEQIFKTISFP